MYMIRYAALVLGMFFIGARTTCSDFTAAFSTTKYCTGFFVGATPFLAAQTFKKSMHHASSSYYTMAFAAGSVASAILFEVIGSFSRAKNYGDKGTKKLGESFIAGMLSGFLGAPMTLWFVNNI